jgi:hypothetical protein
MGERGVGDSPSRDARPSRAGTDAEQVVEDTILRLIEDKIPSAVPPASCPSVDTYAICDQRSDPGVVRVSPVSSSVLIPERIIGQPP